MRQEAVFCNWNDKELRRLELAFGRPDLTSVIPLTRGWMETKHGIVEDSTGLHNQQQQQRHGAGNGEEVGEASM